MSYSSNLFHSIISINPASKLTIRNISPSSNISQPYVDVLQSKVSLINNPNNNSLPKTYTKKQNFIILRHEIPCQVLLELPFCNIKIEYNFERVNRTQKISLLQKSLDSEIEIEQLSGSIPSIQISWSIINTESLSSKQFKLNSLDNNNHNKLGDDIDHQSIIKQENNNRLDVNENELKSNLINNPQMYSMKQLFSHQNEEQSLESDEYDDTSEILTPIPISKVPTPHFDKNHNQKKIIYYYLDKKKRNNEELQENVLKQIQMTCHGFLLKNISQFLSSITQHNSKKPAILLGDSFSNNRSNLLYLIIIRDSKKFDNKKIEKLKMISTFIYEFSMRDLSEIHFKDKIFNENLNDSNQVLNEFKVLTGIQTNIPYNRIFELGIFGNSFLPSQQNKLTFKSMGEQLRFDYSANS